jgi:uncharacterized protein YdeI (YjbR/CyaY-like superfamily)
MIATWNDFEEGSDIEFGIGDCLIQAQQHSALAGHTVVYTHVLTNTGKVTDAFTLTASSSNGWLMGINPTSAMLLSHTGTLVTLTLTVPAAHPAAVDTLAVTATSWLQSKRLQQSGEHYGNSAWSLCATCSTRIERGIMITASRVVHFINRDEWRAWLKEHHATAKEAWLVHYKKHTGKPGLSLEEAVEEALCFGWIDGVLKPVDEEKFSLRYSPRKKDSVWSETNKRRVRKLIRQGRMTEAGLAKVKEAKANGQWRAATLREDTTKIPDDLKKALKADPRTWRKFEGLAPSRKRQYLY